MRGHADSFYDHLCVHAAWKHTSAELLTLSVSGRQKAPAFSTKVECGASKFYSIT